MPSSSRRYVKRIWQVPKTRGPVECLATLICKALRKHGWPAGWRPAYDPFSFVITDERGQFELGGDFMEAVSICCRITARTYAVDITEELSAVTINRRYRVTEHGKFREETE